MSLFAALRLKRIHFHHQQLLTINPVAQLGFLTADGCLSHLTYGTWSGQPAAAVQAEDSALRTWRRCADRSVVRAGELIDWSNLQYKIIFGESIKQ